MLEKPETYEEAKKIIQDAAGNDISQRNRKNEKLRMGIFTGIGLCATAAIGVGMNDPVTAAQIVAVPYTFAMLAEIIPHLSALSRRKKMQDGSFFDNKSEEEIMKMADEYVSAYNEYEQNKGGVVK